MKGGYVLRTQKLSSQCVIILVPVMLVGRIYTWDGMIELMSLGVTFPGWGPLKFSRSHNSLRVPWLVKVYI
jgi:hypothetical protein